MTSIETFLVNVIEAKSHVHNIIYFAIQVLYTEFLYEPFKTSCKFHFLF